MTNWLESEEKKKEEDALKEKVRFERWSSLQGNLQNNLISFFDLCKRVNALRNCDKLKINYNGVTGINFYFITYAKRDYDAFSNYLYYERVIEFNYRENPERIELDVYFQEQYESSSSLFKEPYQLFNKHPRHLYRKEINLDDVINWNEENKLNCIKWLIGELDTGKLPFSGYDDGWDSYIQWLNAPIEFLPGKSNIIPIFDFKTQLYKLEKDLGAAKETLVELDNWQLFRSDREKRNQISNQEEKIKNIKREISNLGMYIPQ